MMGKPGFVRNVREDSEYAERLRTADDRIFQRLLREHTVRHGHALMMAGLFYFERVNSGFRLDR